MLHKVLFFSFFFCRTSFLSRSGEGKRRVEVCVCVGGVGKRKGGGGWLGI